MKKTLLLLLFAILNLQNKAQTSATIAIQFYVDANNNCAYNTGEQLIYNIPANLLFMATTGSVQSAYISTPTITTCNASTVYVFSQSLTPTNTLSINAPLFGINANISCGNYTNLPYNTNTIQYLPVTLSNTLNLGTQVGYLNYYSSAGTYTYGNLTSINNTIGICSNIGSDSITMYFNIFNYLNCNTTASISPRTYSLFLDGVNYDKIITTGAFGSYNSTVGINALSKANEYYWNSQTYLYLYPKLPTTFSALGAHTFEVKSSMIYNNVLSTVNFSCILNSIPCSKVSGRFYNDCNSNCVFDGLDNYGVGWYATGKIYNASGFNVLFHPNYFDGKFSVYIPSTAAYSLTQYPTYTSSSIFNFTACTTGTTTIPISANTNSLLYGYKNSAASIVDPGIWFWRTASTSASLSPMVGVTFGVSLFNNWWNICNTSTLNPGKIKITLPKQLNYAGALSGPTPTFVSGALADTLIWAVPNFSNVNGWWSNYYSTFSLVVSATAVPNSTIGIYANITPLTDVNLNNNSYNWVRTIGGPFDPNGKITEATGLKSNGDVPYGTQQFYYTIGFQNVGNAPAINVKTLDTIDVNFDLNTLEVLQSSYPVNTQIDNVSRAVIFNFDGINLPEASANEVKSHGFVRYGIKLKPGVPNNTVLKNRAHNYFDFNAPVPTNQTDNKLIFVTSIESTDNSLNVLKAIPNPIIALLNLQSQKVIKNVQVYNMLGDLMMEVYSDSNEMNLSFENLPSAVYIIKVKASDETTSTVKIIKQ